MIEIVSATACIACDVCIRVCPTDVFDRGPDGIPVIQRQSDCQTCFMCEVYCPTDALYVSPVSAPVDAESPHADEEAVRQAGLFGDYRELVGWGRGRTAGARYDQNAALGAVEPLGEPQLRAPAVRVDGPWNHLTVSRQVDR